MLTARRCERHPEQRATAKSPLAAPPAPPDPQPLETEVYPADRLFAPHLLGGLGGQTRLPWSDPVRGSPRFGAVRGKMLVSPAHPSDGNSWDGFCSGYIKHCWSQVPPGGFRQPSVRILITPAGDLQHHAPAQALTGAHIA